MLTLNEYLAAPQNERGEQKRLEREAGVSHETIRQVLKGRAVRDVRIARRLSAATGGKVPVWLLMQLKPSDVEGLERTGKHMRRASGA
jgi:transcriptional regulator with XRE-family HTH domain